MRLLQILLLTTFFSIGFQALDSQELSSVNPLTYADIADLALAAPVAAHVQIAKARRLRGDQADGVPPGHSRFLIDADVVALIRGAGGLPGRVSYLVDLPNDSRGRPQRIGRRAQYLILAESNPAEPGDLRLIAPDAQIPFTPIYAERIRSILTEAAQADAPPRITGIGRAFHVPGNLPGEGETQIFLMTSTNRPISLSVLRRPGQRPSWSVATNEIIDAAATAPEPDTLQWYRLACFLPRSLPARSLSDSTPDQARKIETDYRFMLETLGPCIRNRQAR